jgi:hypothetical protein
MTSLLIATLLCAAGDEVVEEVADVEVMTEQDTWYGLGYPQFDRTFNILSAKTARPGSYVVNVAHRTNKAVWKDPFYNYLGFDAGGLKIGLMVRFGLFEGLDMGVSRLNGTNEKFDTYEFDARYQILNQKDHVVDLAVRAGGTWFAQKDNQAVAWFGQLLVDHVLANRVMITGALMHHSDSSNSTKTNDDPDYSTALGLALDLRLSAMLAFDVEVSSTIAGYAQKGKDLVTGAEGTSYPAFTIGPKVVTNRHTFALVFTNTQYILADGIITNSKRKPENVILGFNITREL